MCTIGKQLAAILGFTMIAAVSSLSVPGLLEDYDVVDGADRIIFKLDVLVDAEHFNLTATLSSQDEIYKKACKMFIAQTTGKELELLLTKKVDWTNLKKKDCRGKLSLHVSCESVSSGAQDCRKTGDYNISLMIAEKVSFAQILRS